MFYYGGVYHDVFTFSPSAEDLNVSLELNVLHHNGVYVDLVALGIPPSEDVIDVLAVDVGTDLLV